MLKTFLAAASVICIVAAGSPRAADSLEIPLVRVFPSSMGDVSFQHQTHSKTLAIKCVECHHQIDARKLSIPHPDYFKSPSVKCEICHGQAEKVAQKAYICSECHRTKLKNIADETLGTKVVIHKQCWKCHEVGTGKEASSSCEKCHAGRKSS